VKGTKYNRLLFRLVPSMRRTGGTESGLLPTVQTQGLKVCNQNGKTEYMRLNLLPTPTAMMPRDTDMKKREARMEKLRAKGLSPVTDGLSILAIKGLLPTPIASDRLAGIKVCDKSPKFQGTPKLADFATSGLFPTPTASCRNGGHATGRETELNHYIRQTFQTGETSQLNPLFVGEMMGFPEGWTVLPFQNGGQNQSAPSETQ
jgi:hypothetical protein